jgi:hypothetical protein
MGEQYVCIHRAIGQPVLEGPAAVAGTNHGAGLDGQVHATVTGVSDAVDMMSPRPTRSNSCPRSTCLLARTGLFLCGERQREYTENPSLWCKRSESSGGRREAEGKKDRRRIAVGSVIQQNIYQLLLALLFVLFLEPGLSYKAIGRGRSLLLHQRSSALADFLEHHFKTTKFLRT